MKLVPSVLNKVYYINKCQNNFFSLSSLGSELKGVTCPWLFWPLSKADSSWLGLPFAFGDPLTPNHRLFIFQGILSCIGKGTPLVCSPGRESPLPLLPSKTSECVDPCFNCWDVLELKAKDSVLTARHGWGLGSQKHTGHPSMCFSMCGRDLMTL